MRGAKGRVLRVRASCDVERRRRRPGSARGADRDAADRRSQATRVGDMGKRSETDLTGGLLEEEMLTRNTLQGRPDMPEAILTSYSFDGVTTTRRTWHLLPIGMSICLVRFAQSPVRHGRHESVNTSL